MKERGSISELFAPGDFAWDKPNITRDAHSAEFVKKFYGFGLADLIDHTKPAGVWSHTSFPVSNPEHAKPIAEADIWAMMQKINAAHEYKAVTYKFNEFCPKCGAQYSHKHPYGICPEAE